MPAQPEWYGTHRDDEIYLDQLPDPGGWGYYAEAGDGDDWVYGTAWEDNILGGAGADWLYGGNGTDWIWGGEGNDDILGGAARDFLYGEAGNDRIWGGDGNDA